MATTANTQSDAAYENAAVGFGLSAAITVVFNVVLAFIKDSWPALNSFMAMLTGHHWRTHGLVDVILFVLLGWFFTSRGVGGGKLTNSTAVTVGGAVIIASAALGLWFLFI
jgi:hypothetical protein